MDDAIRWIEPFRPLQLTGEEEALQGQLEREVSRLHTLWGKGTKVIGRCTANDDIVVQFLDEESNSRFALVHLTWGTGPGNAEYPSATIYASAQDLSKAMWREAVWMGFVDEFDAGDSDPWNGNR